MIYSVALMLVLFSSLPAITNYLPIRQVNIRDQIVADIESHLPRGNPYKESDLIGWVHEGTHGINSQLRNLYGKPAFYVLRNRAIIFQEEPRGTLSAVAKAVPVSLRGTDYYSHLIDTQRWWENEPEYLFDEFVAYTNGSEEWLHLGKRQHRSETIKLMIEYVAYSTCVMKACKFNDKQARLFLMWQIERAMRIYKQSGIISTYLRKLRTTPDAAELRQFMRDYYGVDWCKQTLGL